MIDKAKDIDNILCRELAPDRYCYIHNFIVEKDKEIERLNNIINELEKYTIENIEVLENRLNSPFCNFEKATKELSIFQNYLDKLKELKESVNNEQRNL